MTLRQRYAVLERTIARLGARLAVAKKRRDTVECNRLRRRIQHVRGLQADLENR